MANINDSLSNQLLSKSGEILNNYSAAADAVLKANVGLQSNLSREFQDWYMNEINQYQGTEWYQGLLQNPYLKYNYQQTFWDKIGAGTGLWHSGEEQIRQDYETKAREYLAQQIENMRQQEHNSPVNQVDQQREAGLNPDLTGLPSNSGLASENDNLQNAPDLSNMSSSEGFDRLLSVGSSMMNVVMNIVGFAQTVQGLSAGAQGIFSQQLDNATKEADFMRKISPMMGLFSPKSASKINDISDKNATWTHPDTKEVFNLYDLFHDSEGNVISFSKLGSKARDYLSLIEFQDIANEDNLLDDRFFSSLPSSARKRIMSRLNSYRKSPQFLQDYYTMMTGAEGSRKTLAGFRSQPGYSGFDDLMSVFGEAMSKLSYDTQYSKTDYDKKVYESLIAEGVPHAEALQRANLAKRDEADNKVFDDMRKTFMGMVKGQNKFWGYLGLFFLPMIRSALKGSK